MTFDNRITNGIENETKTDAQGNNEISMEADIVKDVEGLDEINSEEEMRAAFGRIQEEIETTVSSAELRLLYRRGADLIELLESPAFQERVGERLGDIRRAAEEEFAKTARALNRHGAEIGAKANYAEEWRG